MLATASYTSRWLARVPSTYLLADVAAPPPCTAVHVAHSGVIYRFDGRLSTVTNTLADPATAQVDLALRSACPTAAKTFLNRAFCVPASTCAQTRFSSADMLLDTDTLRAYYEKARRYVYAVEGLRLEDEYAVSPCAGDGFSRWRRAAGACADPTSLASSTAATIVAAIRAAAVAGIPVADIDAGACDDSPSALGASVDVDGECWEHVHPQTLDVLDFTYWTSAHPGNKNVRVPSVIWRLHPSSGDYIRHPAMTSSVLSVTTSTGMRR